MDTEQPVGWCRYFGDGTELTMVPTSSTHLTFDTVKITLGNLKFL